MTPKLPPLFPSVACCTDVNMEAVLCGVGLGKCSTCRENVNKNYLPEVGPHKKIKKEQCTENTQQVDYSMQRAIHTRREGRVIHQYMSDACNTHNAHTEKASYHCRQCRSTYQLRTYHGLPGKWLRIDLKDLHLVVVGADFTLLFVH